VVAFGPFRLHAAQRRIEKDGNPVLLAARAFDILVALIERAGMVVSKNELITRVWPGVTVDESSLRVHVAALRRALGDGKAGARYLSTVSGQGYCFVGQLSSSDDAQPVPITPALVQAHNLPARKLQMVGRNQTVDEISHKLTSKRFVTVVGPGGIGKTTVAVSTGHALLAQFAGQVRFIDFGVIRDAALVPSIVASALGLPAPSSDPSDSLVAFLRDKRMLLILDCCEHVIEISAALAERLYREAPQLHILATSRELLRVEGEHIHRLLPLASPPQEASLTATSALTFPAVELFVERAAASGGEFELTDANAPDVGNICRRLDGIALAIELTASRVCAYGVKPTIELLDSQFNLLWEGRRTAPPRHRTLRATIEWSYELLSESERAILGRLSVFFGNFTLEAAWSVARTEQVDDAALMAVFASLVAKSMLTLNTSNPSARYRLLDTTRVYAQEKLAASGEAEATAQRHATYFLHLLERLGDGSSENLSAIADQFGNIRGALTWCFSERGDRAIGVALAAASMPLFLKLSLLAECQMWAMRAIEALDETAGSTRCDIALHSALGSARMFTGQIDETTAACLNRAFELAQSAGDVKSQLGLTDRLHLLHVFAGNVDEALNIVKRGEVTAESNDEFVSLARMRVSLSISHHYLGNVAASRSYIEAAFSRPELLEADACDHLTFDYPGRAHITRARILWVQGYPDQAMELVRPALSDLIAMDYPLKLCRALPWAFAVFVWNSEAEDFDQYIDRLLLEARKHDLGTVHMIGEAMRGVVLMARGELGAGLATLRDSVTKMQRHRFGPVTDFSTQLAEALTMAGQSDEALEFVDQAIARATLRNYLLDMPSMLRVKGEALISMKAPDFPEAERCLMQSLNWARQQEAPGLELVTAVSLARLWLRQGRSREARDLLAPVYARFTEGFNTRLLTGARDLLDELGSPRSGSPAIT
jgi:predicted ATPase/DNA-binding winged helix-turn-helix (wHTH) protein